MHQKRQVTLPHVTEFVPKKERKVNAGDKACCQNDWLHLQPRTV